MCFFISVLNVKDCHLIPRTIHYSPEDAVIVLRRCLGLPCKAEDVWQVTGPPCAGRWSSEGQLGAFLPRSASLRLSVLLPSPVFLPSTSPSFRPPLRPPVILCFDLSLRLSSFLSCSSSLPFIPILCSSAPSPVLYLCSNLSPSVLPALPSPVPYLCSKLSSSSLPSPVLLLCSNVSSFGRPLPSPILLLCSSLCSYPLVQFSSPNKKMAKENIKALRQ